MCCCAIASVPPPEKVTPDTPLRLEIAATLAFPDGSMPLARAVADYQKHRVKKLKKQGEK